MLTPSTYDEQVAGKVRGQLAERGARQADAAAELGLNQSTLSRRLAGKSSFTIGELHRLAQWLRLYVTDLLPAEGSLLPPTKLHPAVPA